MTLIVEHVCCFSVVDKIAEQMVGSHPDNGIVQNNSSTALDDLCDSMCCCDSTFQSLFGGRTNASVFSLSDNEALRSWSSAI